MQLNLIILLNLFLFNLQVSDLEKKEEISVVKDVEDWFVLVWCW